MSRWDVTTETNSVKPYSDVSDISDIGYSFPNYALCLPRYSKLDGVYTNAPNVIPFGGCGYVSDVLSDSKGNFAVEPQITLTYARVKSSKGINLVFNPLSGDYCSSLTVEYYRNDRLQESIDFEPDSSEYLCEHQSSYFNKLVITFHKTSKPYRYLFLGEFAQYRLVNGKGIEIVYEDLAVGAHNDFEPSSIDVKGLVDVSSLKKTYEFPSYALCLPRYSKLNGNYENMVEFEQCGYISNSISDDMGLFDTPPKLELTLNNFYTSVGISITFNSLSGDYCDKVKCQWYANDTLLDENEFEITSYNAFLNQKVENYNKVVLTFLSTSKPYRNVFVSDVQFGIVRTFDKKTVKVANCLQEVNPISEELSINTLDFTIKSDTDIAFDFQQRQPCTLYFDSNVLGVFYIVGGKRTSYDEYEFQTEDIVSMLDREYCYGGFYNDTLANVFADILGDTNYYLDDELESVVFEGYIPYGTKREALQLVCFATGAIVDTSFDTRMFIYPYRVEKEVEILPSEQYLGATTTESDTIVTGVKVEINHYTANDKSTKLFSGQVNGTMEITFNAAHHSYTITGGTIESYGDNYCVISGNGEVVLNGSGYDNDVTYYMIENPNVTLNKNVAEVEGVSCINETNYLAVAQRLYDWYVGKSITNATIKVGEHELSECVKINTFDGDRVGLITSMQYQFSAATMKANIKIE